MSSGLHGFSLDRDGFGFLLEVKKEPSSDDVNKWGALLKSHVRQVERVGGEQIDAAYCINV